MFNKFEFLTSRSTGIA